MSNQVRATKYMMDESKEDLHSIGNQVADIVSQAKGSLSKNTAYCKRCGMSIDEDSTFCKHCGKKQY